MSLSSLSAHFYLFFLSETSSVGTWDCCGPHTLPFFSGNVGLLWTPHSILLQWECGAAVDPTTLPFFSGNVKLLWTQQTALSFAHSLCLIDFIFSGSFNCLIFEFTVFSCVYSNLPLNHSRKICISVLGFFVSIFLLISLHGYYSSLHMTLLTSFISSFVLLDILRCC